MLSDPRFQIQHQKTSQPPVPKFPNVLSSLGKRNQDREDSVEGATKRPRQFEIPQTLREESLVSSIERDQPAASVDLVEAPEALSRHEGDGRQHAVRNVKAESPEYWRAWRDMPAASIDELEQLQEQPTGFTSRRRASNPANKTQVDPEPNGLYHRPIQRTTQQHEDSQAPITPPSEPSHRHASSSKRSLPRPKSATNSSRLQSSASASKFKKPLRRDIYDFPESDIDDSQMSPRSKMATLRQQKSIDHLSHIENQRSPELGVDSANRFSVAEAMNFLDNESVFDDNGLPGDLLQPTSSLLNGNNSYVNGPASGLIYEDTDEINENDHSRNGHQYDATVNIPSDTAEDEQEKENRPVQPPPVRVPQESLSGRRTPPAASLESGPQGQPSTPASARKRKRTRKSKADSANAERDSQMNSEETSFDSANARGINKTFRRESGNERETPSLDSPGEQLSQSLQESARKASSAQTLKEKLEAQIQLASSHSSKTTHGKGRDKSISNEPQPSTKNADENKAKGNAASTKPAKRQRKGKQSDNDIEPPTINVEQMEQTLVPSTPAPENLPHWGSATTIVEKTKAPIQDQRQFLTAENPSELRKSPSIALGLTDEEIKIMKSREGMTQEQYDAEKKKKQLEARLFAAEQRKKNEATLRRESLGKTSATKPELSNVETSTAPASSSKASVSRKSLPTDDGSGSIKEKKKKASGDAASTTAKSTTSTKKSPSAKPGTAAAFAKTPPKTSTKTPSVKSANTATKKPAPTKTESKNLPASGSTKAPESKSTPKPDDTEPKPTPTTVATTKDKKAPVPTIREAQNLKNLHKAIKSAQDSMISALTTTSRASSTLPNHKRSALNSASSDDDSSDDAESSSSSSEEERNKRVQRQQKKKEKEDTAAQNAVAQKKSNTAETKSKPAAPKKGQPAAVAAAPSSSSSTSNSDSSSEDEYELKQTQAARAKKQAAAAAAEARAKSISRPATATSSMGRPDPSIRDASVDPSSSSSSSDDSDGEL